MKCRFYTGKFMMTCRAGLTAYVPSSFEIGEYCGNSRHKMCPLYARARNLEERRIFLSDSKVVIPSVR